MVQRRGARSIFLPLLCIALFALTIAVHGIFIWASLAPLFVFFLGRESWKRILAGAAAAALSWAAIAGYWTSSYSALIFALVIIGVSLFLFLFLCTAAFMLRAFPPWLSLFSVPLAWIALQELFSHSVIDSYWASLAIFSPSLSPLLGIVGREGTTFLIILANVLFSFALSLPRDRMFRAMSALLVTALLSIAGFSYFLEPQGDPFTVALVQPNIQRSWEWRMAHVESDILPLLENMTLSVAARNHPDVILWPEYAVPDDVFLRPHLARRLGDLSRAANATLILGSLRWTGGSYSDSQPYKNDVVLAFSPQGELLSAYTASHPLPYEPQTLPAERMELLTLGGEAIGASLCYEETQKDVSRFHRASGARYAVSLANDLAFTRSSVGLRHSSLYSRLNAAESGMYVLRATNTGITQVINPYGKVVGQLPSNSRGILVRTIYLPPAH